MKNYITTQFCGATFIADTTFYRKTTAYKLGEQILTSAIPHLLMPTPGSPERFQGAGRAGPRQLQPASPAAAGAGAGGHEVCRAARAREVLRSWYAQGYSVRHILTEALLKLDEESEQATSLALAELNSCKTGSTRRLQRKQPGNRRKY